jgi:hypothetical protein
MLLAAGADPNIECAVVHNSWFIYINEGIEGGEYGMALQAASCAGHPEIVRLLGENRAEVDARGEVLF